MHYAIFDTGPGFLQWMGEAADPLAAIQELHAESDEYDNDEQDPTEPFIVVYQLTDQEVALLDDLLSKGEHIYQDFNDEGNEFTLSQVRQIVGS
jgi:K+/H+ antiporter YhaU regulatory subunit KhtT